MSASRSQCMEASCKAPPEHEALWADGRARAWFCGKHYAPWKKAQGDSLELVKERKVTGGEVGTKYGDKSSAWKRASVTATIWETPDGTWDELLDNPAALKLELLGVPDSPLRMANLRLAKKSVGLFIQLPEELAKQFPDLGPKDDSPSHATFLFVGDIPKERKAEFLKVTEEAFAEVGTVNASLDGLDYFQSQTGRVAISRVRFDRDIIQLHDRVKARLNEAGFNVQHSFPFLTPHVTLGYLGPFDDWKGEVPKGSWSFNSISVWGLPSEKSIEIPFGRAPSRIASQRRLDEKRNEAALLRARWAGLLR